ncbi:hypothetical protein XarbCFBP7610_02625 [Xanthomonas arboricola]|nr:hypothetical protein XarbCFBP7610_02625 [Xanthomonas arboricola]
MPCVLIVLTNVQWRRSYQPMAARDVVCQPPRAPHRRHQAKAPQHIKRAHPHPLSRFPDPPSRFPALTTPQSRLPNPSFYDSRIPIPDSRFPIPSYLVQPHRLASLPP